MPTHYRVYANGGLGWDVPVDLSTPLETVTDGSTEVDVTLADGDWLIVVRAYDTEADLEDGNLDAVRLRLRDGLDRTGLPGPPLDLAASDQGGGSILLVWTDPPDRGGRATQYRIWATVGSSVDDTVTPTVTQDRSPGPVQVAQLSLTPGVGYAIGIRGVNGSGPSDLSTPALLVTPVDDGPDPVESLASGPTA